MKLLTHRFSHNISLIYALAVSLYLALSLALNPVIKIDTYGVKHNPYDVQTQIASINPEGEGYTYLDKVLANENTITGEAYKLEQIDYYDQQVEMGVLSEMLILAATQGMAPWASFAFRALAEGIITGEINPEDLLKDAAMTYVTAGVGEFAIEGASGLSGFEGVTDKIMGNFDNLSTVGLNGTKYFSERALTNTFVNAGVTSLTGTALYGGDLVYNFKTSLTNAAIDETVGMAIDGASDVYGHEGFSVQKSLIKAAANCAGAEAKGSECYAGALGTVAAEFYLANVDTSQMTVEEIKAGAERTAIVIGAFASGGEVDNLNTTIGAAALDVENNYLNKDQLTKFIEDMEDCASEGYLDNECATAVRDTYDELSAANEAEMLKCTTLECWEYHRELIQGGSDVWHQLQASGSETYEIFRGGGVFGDVYGYQFEEGSGHFYDYTASAVPFDPQTYVEIECDGLADAICMAKMDKESRAENAAQRRDFWDDFVPVYGDAEAIYDDCISSGASDGWCIASIVGVMGGPVYDGARKIGKAADSLDTTTLYRGVSAEEYQDIMDTGKFRANPNGGSFDGKQFGFDKDEVYDLTNKFPETSGVIQVEVPTDVLNDVGDFTPVDQHILKSGSVTIQPDQLDNFNNCVTGICDALDK